MTITLTIDNMDSLPDGGPIRFQAHEHGFEMGREQHLDWTLPDPARYISGRHCEVRYEDGAYWLHDVSSNGTYLNGAQSRVKSPYRLAHGDRLSIGHYIIRVELGEDAGAEAPPTGQSQPVEPPPAPEPSASPADIWSVSGETPPPVKPRDVMPEKPGRRAPEFPSHFVDLPSAKEPAPAVWPQEEPGGAQPPSGGSESPFGPGSAPAPAGEGFLRERQVPPVPEPHPAPERRAPPATGGDAAAFVAALARGAGVSTETFLERDAQEVAQEIGEVLAASVENLAQLLKARAAAKTMTKSTSRTMIGAADNNPLKFVPAASEAIEIMFRHNRSGYMGARQSVEEAFADLKGHELATYAAMQKALARLLDDLAPDTIEAKISGSAFPLKKGRAWDLFVTRWEEKSAGANGMLDAFLAYFAEAYDEASRKK